jgi:hypothetical protein
MRAKLIVLGVLWYGISSASAQSFTMDVIDFLVDQRGLIGQKITITDCRFTAASETQLLCSAGMQGNVSIDARSLPREDHRRAMRECGSFSVPDSCAGSVTGSVTRGSLGVRITDAAIGWRPR